MANWKKFFEVSEEHSAKVARLFTQAALVGVCVALLGGMWMKHRYQARSKKKQEGIALKNAYRDQAFKRFIEHPTLFDTYIFNGTTGGPDRRTEIPAKILSIDLPEIVFIFFDGPHDIGLHPLRVDQLNRLAQKDTINLTIGEASLSLTGIKSYNRTDGPNLRTYSSSRHDITLRVSDGSATIQRIETLTGSAGLKAGLPYTMEEGSITFQITKKKDRAEFIVHGTSEQSDEWSRRILIHGWDALVFPE
ncbi:MAG: hypothetical protein AAF598_12130 [Bacteroidota bacterium]